MGRVEMILKRNADFLAAHPTIKTWAQNDAHTIAARQGKCAICLEMFADLPKS